mmetsp:Transcript_4467/g.7639  ORF Transcript_4467/g.7639 Transcript_4467/m.7639 type:complete len:128 (-) Transcript_4467:1211-1594(-)
MKHQKITRKKPSDKSTYQKTTNQGQNIEYKTNVQHITMSSTGQQRIKQQKHSITNKQCEDIMRCLISWHFENEPNFKNKNKDRKVQNKKSHTKRDSNSRETKQKHNCRKTIYIYLSRHSPGSSQAHM